MKLVNDDKVNVDFHRNKMGGRSNIIFKIMPSNLST